MSERHIKIVQWVNGEDSVVTVNDKVLQEHEIVELLVEYMVENKKLKQELFEARRDYLIDTADISDKLYLDKEIGELRKEMLG